VTDELDFATDIAALVESLMVGAIVMCGVALVLVLIAHVMFGRRS
jgi:hypothetical protein